MPRPNNPPQRQQYSTNNDKVSCNCGSLARRLTVQKEGPNKGRDFFGCPKPREESCRFFQWADEDPSTGGTGIINHSLWCPFFFFLNWSEI